MSSSDPSAGDSGRGRERGGGRGGEGGERRGGGRQGGRGFRFGGRGRHYGRGVGGMDSGEGQQQQQQLRGGGDGSSGGRWNNRGGGGSVPGGGGGRERGGRAGYFPSYGRGGAGYGHRGGGRGEGRGRGGRGGRYNNTRGRAPFSGGADTGSIEEFGERQSTTSSSSSSSVVTIAVEGCCHGELDAIYDRLSKLQEATGYKIDLLLCCGDFQSLRNLADFHSLAVPRKYRALGSFAHYYSGQKTAPILTIFVGGNHEASQSLQELPYGGWVAPNIYYMGRAGVVQYKGIRIGGVSGIYKFHNYEKGHYEHAPFDGDSMRSVYHVRRDDIYRLKCLAAGNNNSNNIKITEETTTLADGTENDSDPCLGRSRRRLDVMVSHDWPQGIEQFGNTQDLLRRKPFFRSEVETNSLGSPPNRELLDSLQPKWWFAAHLHVKFKARISHQQQQQKKEDDASLKPVMSAAEMMRCLVPSQAIKSPSKQQPAAKTTTSEEIQETSSSRTENEQSDAKSNVESTTSAKDSSDPHKSPDKTTTSTTDTTTADTATATMTTQFIAQESKDPCVGPDLTEQMTQFLSLDKCLPRRQYLSILHIPIDQSTTAVNSATEQQQDASLDVHKNNETAPVEASEGTEKGQNNAGDAVGDQKQSPLEYDPEWLAILKRTHSLTTVSPHRQHNVLPAVEPVTPEEIDWIIKRFSAANMLSSSSEPETPTKTAILPIPGGGFLREGKGQEEASSSPSKQKEGEDYFQQTVPGHNFSIYPKNLIPLRLPPPLPRMGNPQMDELLKKLELDHITTIPYQPNLALIVSPPSMDSANRGATNDGTNGVMAADGNEIDLDGISEDPDAVGAAVGGDENEIDLDSDGGDNDDEQKIDSEAGDEPDGQWSGKSQQQQKA